VILALEHADLQAQGHDFKSNAVSGAKEGSEPFKETEDKSGQGSSLHGSVVIPGYLVNRWFPQAIEFWRQTGL